MRFHRLIAALPLLAGAACAADAATGPGVNPRLANGDWTRPSRPPNILLRGPKAVRVLEVDNKPLWVVDGVVSAGQPRGLEPSSIVSIEVLKGAAATALYGTEAAHGVIIVTTRGAAPSPRR